MLSGVWCLLSGRRLGCRANQEEETGRSLLGADVAHRGRSEKDAAHRPQHVLARRPGAHQPGQDQILPGTPQAPPAAQLLSFTVVPNDTERLYCRETLTKRCESSCRTTFICKER